MTKIFLVFLVLLFFTLPLFAQSVDTAWVRRYNGSADFADLAYDIAVDNSGNAYVMGPSFGSGTGNDYATIKYYANGDTAWVRRYNGPANSDDVPSALAVDGSGSVYVTGASYGGNTTGYDYLTIKYFPNGDTAWVRRYNGYSGDYAKDIAVDSSGNAYVTGNSYIGIATIKYHSAGDTAWVRRKEGSIMPLSGYWAYAIVIDGSGNCYVAGENRSSFAGHQWDGYYVVKYYSDGGTAWGRSYGAMDSGPLYANHIAVDYQNNVYVLGSGPVIKYDANGGQKWIGAWGGANLAAGDSNNVCVTGGFYFDTTNSDYRTIRYLSNGDTAWVRRYNGPGNSGDYARALATDGSGNVYVTGYSYGIGSYYDYATIKYYPNGDTAWTVRYNGPADSNDYTTDIALDDSGNVYVTGYSHGAGTGYDFATIKYVQFLRGDANKDKKVNIADAVCLVYYLLKGGPAPGPWQAGDANCDSTVTVADVVYLVSFLFKHGPQPCR